MRAALPSDVLYSRKWIPLARTFGDCGVCDAAFLLKTAMLPPGCHRCPETLHQLRGLHHPPTSGASPMWWFSVGVFLPLGQLVIVPVVRFHPFCAQRYPWRATRRRTAGLVSMSLHSRVALLGISWGVRWPGEHSPRPYSPYATNDRVTKTAIVWFMYCYVAKIKNIKDFMNYWTFWSEEVTWFVIGTSSYWTNPAFHSGCHDIKWNGLTVWRNNNDIRESYLDIFIWCGSWMFSCSSVYILTLM